MHLDAFGAAFDSLTVPVRNCYSINRSNTAALPFLPKAIYEDTGGALVVRVIDGSSDVTFTNVANGTILNVRVMSVRATRATATNLIGLA
jgi:hypothetical protein